MRLGLSKLRGTTLATALLALCGSATLGICQSAGESGVRVSIDVRARPEPVRDAAPAFRVDVELVLIPVSVTDPLGNPVTGLSRENFHLFEDGIQQDIRYFSAQDAPASIGIVFDASRSMKPTMGQARQAVLRLLRRSQPGDEYFLIAFNNRPQMLSTFADGVEHLERQVMAIHPDGWTALLDSVSLALNTMKHARNERKALVVLSDGGDNKSHLRKGELRSQIREADTSIYSIGLLGQGLSEHDLQLMSDMSAETGARMFPVKSVDDLPGTIDEISLSLRTQYLLGYSSPKSGDGLYRTVKVGLSKPPGAPPLRAAWRPGYYSGPRAEGR
jgi:Ca-activated chloride channel family protein